MSPAYQEFVALLRSRGLIPDKSPPAPNADRPWFVALLQGVAGWIAGIFLLSFVGLIIKPESSGAILVLGALLLGAAWALYHADRDAVFLDQLALAISIAGQFAVAWGIVKEDLSGLPIASTLLGLQLLVLLIMPNKVARTLAALFATIAWVFTVRFALRPGQGEQIFFDGGHGGYAPLLGAWTLPLAWTLTWVPLLALAAWLIRNESRWMSSGLRRYARPLLTGILLGLSLGGIAAEPFTVFALGIESMGMRFSWWALFPLLSIALAMFSAWGAFRIRSLGLSGFAIFAALLHLSRFYYLYGTTLLWKAVIMLAVGAALLFAGIALQKRSPQLERAP
jgi:uncharacterized protein DUF4401